MPVSRTCGLLAFARSPAIAITDLDPRVATALEEADAERDHLAVGVPGGGDADRVDQPGERIVRTQRRAPG